MKVKVEARKEIEWGNWRRYRLLGSSELPQFEIVLLHSAQIVYLLLKTSAFAQ
jgi:hypothetical protein